MSKNFKWDTKAVIAAAGRVQAEALKFTAMDIQRAAKRSMKKKKDFRDAAHPGSAPHAHEGGLKSSVRFAWDPNRQSAVVGPVKYKGRSKGAKALEYGGVVRIKVQKEYETKSVFDRKEKLTYYAGGGRKKHKYKTSGRTYKPMSERSEKEQDAIRAYYKGYSRTKVKTVWITVNMQARPSIGPAMKREMKKMGDRLRRAAKKFKR